MAEFWSIYWNPERPFTLEVFEKIIGLGGLKHVRLIEVAVALTFKSYTSTLIVVSSIHPATSVIVSVIGCVPWVAKLKVGGEAPVAVDGVALGALQLQLLILPEPDELFVALTPCPGQICSKSKLKLALTK